MDPTEDTREMSLAELLAELREELVRLVRSEVALARAEMAAKARDIGRNVGLAVAGALVGYTALIFLLLAATAGTVDILAAVGVADGVAGWLGPLLVGLVVGAVAAILVSVGVRRLRSFSPTPTRTMDAIQETRRWIERKIS